MALPFKKPGGSFLNGVSGIINSLTFKLGKSGETKDGRPWQQYSGVVVITPDGGSPTEQYLHAGFLDDGFSVSSKDGRSIDGEGTYELDTDTPLGKFVVSLVDQGEGKKSVPEALLGDLRNYDGIAGTRATFVRVVDEEATKKLGKRKGKEGTKSAGKEFDRDNLLVSEVISLPEPKKSGQKTTAPKAAKATAPAAAPAAPAPAAVASTAATADPDDDTELKAILEANGGTLDQGKLSAAAVRYAMKNQGVYNPKAREALRVKVMDEAYLAAAVAREAIAIEGDGASRTVILAS